MRVKIEEKEFDIEFNGGTLRNYRRFFGRDFLTDIFDVGNALSEEVIENVTWLVCWQANKDIEPIDEWLEGFKEPLSIYAAWKDVYAVLLESCKTLIEPDKKSKKKVKQTTKNS